MDKWLQLLKSRKFWAMLVGLVVLFVGERAGVDQEQLTNATYLIVSFILGTALEFKKAQG
jgi:predicted membrane chloride channel (bestrophin family)